MENDIIIGVYPRGEILTELKLVEQLGVSRTPIREALRRLEQDWHHWIICLDMSYKVDSGIKLLLFGSFASMLTESDI